MEKNNYYTQQSLKIFLKRGIRTVLISDIARHLNISTKTIYKIYGDKNGLIEACLHLDYEIISQTYKKILQHKHAIVALQKFYDALAYRLDSVNSNYFDDIKIYYTNYWDDISQYSTQQIETLIQRGIASGIFHHALDTHLVAQSISLLIRAILEDGYLPISYHNRRHLTANIIYPYLRGICTAEGIRELDYNFNLEKESKLLG